MTDDQERVARTFLALGGVNAFLAVAFGAFGAHGLKDRLTVQALEVYKTGATYHFWHALALILVALVAERAAEPRRLMVVGWLFVVGIVLFSGSLYALAISGVRVLGAITPFGGLCFLGGWLAFALTCVRLRFR